MARYRSRAAGSFLRRGPPGAWAIDGLPDTTSEAPGTMGSAHADRDLDRRPHHACRGVDALRKSATGSRADVSVTSTIGRSGCWCDSRTGTAPARSPPGPPSCRGAMLGQDHVRRARRHANDRTTGVRGDVHGNTAPGSLAGECGGGPSDREREASFDPSGGRRDLQGEPCLAKRRCSHCVVWVAGLRRGARRGARPEQRSGHRTRMSLTARNEHRPCVPRSGRSPGRTRGRESRS